MKKLIAFLLFTVPAFGGTTDGGCFSDGDTNVDVDTDVKHIFNEAEVTFTAGGTSVTVSGTPSGGGDRVSDSETAAIPGEGQFKIDDGKVKHKREGTTRWKTLDGCPEDATVNGDLVISTEGIGSLPLY